MKKIVSVVLIVLMMLSWYACAEPAEKDPFVVLCINCTVNGKKYNEFNEETMIEVIADLPDGQKIDYWKVGQVRVNEFDGQDKVTVLVSDETVIEAFGKYSNEMRPEPSVTPMPLPEGVVDPNATPEPVQDGGDVIDVSDTPMNVNSNGQDMSGVHIYAYGAYLQYLDSHDVADGEHYDTLDFTGPYINPLTKQEEPAGVARFRVVANIESNSEISYWVINGVRYDFNVKVKRITVTELRESMTIEVVYKGQESKTLSRVRGTGACTIRAMGAKMSFIDAKKKTKGGYFTEFDFTEAYTNPAMKETQPAGSITLRVIAKKKPSVWYMNGARFKFSSTVEHFTVYDLNTAMVYEAK